MAPEGEAVPWAQLASQTSARQQDAVRTHRQEREQKRQFDEQQQRLLANDATARDQFAQAQALEQGKLQYQIWKERNDQAAKRQEDLEEGMAILDKAWTESNLVEEYDTAAEMAGNVYDLEITPKGVLPSWLAPQIAAEAEAEAAAEDGIGPSPDAPAGALPPGQAPAPAGAAPAPALAPGQAPAPAGAAPAPELAPGQAPAPAGSAAPAGAAGAAGAAAPAPVPGQAPPPVVTTAAAEVATTAGVNHLGKTVGKVPAVPETAVTAEEAAKANAENPFVDPPQEDMPPANLAQAEERLRNIRPVTELEMLSRTATDAQMAASYQRRIETLKTMGLSPTAFAIAANFAARVHGMPPVAVPPGPVADPNAPPDAQGTGEWNVELPKAVVEFAESPPDVTPSALRDAMESGGHDIWDRRTGKKLATRDFASIQEKRMQKRREEITPIIQGLGTTAKEHQQIKAVAESYILSGDKKYLDILQSVLRIGATGEFRGQTQDRADRTEFLNVTKEMQAQADRIVNDAHQNEGLTKMKETVANTNNTLAVLRGNPGSLQQRKVMTDLLKAAHNGRATDKDAAMSFRAGLWNDVETMWGYLEQGGELPPGFMKQLEDVIKDINIGERRKQIIVAKSMAQQVYENFYMQSVAPQASEWQARAILRRAFPEMPQSLINGMVEEAAKNAPPLGAAAVGYGTPSATSSSSSVREDVRVFGPKTEGGKPQGSKPKPKRKKLKLEDVQGLGSRPPAPAQPAGKK